MIVRCHFVCLLFLCCLAVLPVPAFGRTWVVAANHVAAADANAGTEEQPLKTIQAGANLAQPGDVVLVHGGTYRERVAPPRGGTSEEQRITYRAAPGEQVLVKGSERINTWKDLKNGLWTVQLGKDFFGEYNPYELTIWGEWLDYGEGTHRGDVYLDGVALSEKRAQYEAQKTANSWYCTVENGVTRIWANFGDADPNQRVAEINVRHTVFYPETSGLKYIIVDGLTIMHSAENWGPPGTRNGEGQWGAIGPRWGYAWIIENCTVINAKCIGITLGAVPGTRRSDIESFGHHIVRNNHVLHCGQAGIGGDSGAAVSLIEHNLVEFTNDRQLFGGDETAGIKFHFTVDTVIRGNTVRSVRSGAGYGGFGLWLDFGNQNTRVTGNLFCETQAPCLFIEASHGPVLVDNNVFLGNDINALSESQVFVHNLFYRSTVHWTADSRRPPIYSPHTTKRVRSDTITPRDDHWCNNIFIGGGMQLAPEAPGFVIDYNVFCDGAKKSRYDAHSLVETAPTDFNIFADPDLIAVDWRLTPAALALKGPAINSAMLGKFAVSNMMVENHDGSPIAVDQDFFGQPRKSDAVVPGPFQDLATGLQSHTVWSRIYAPARPYRITVSPADVLVKPGSTQQFTAVVWDQFGKPVNAAKGFTWQVAGASGGGAGTIDANGRFTAGPADAGPVRTTITASLPATLAGPTGDAVVCVSSENPGLVYALYEGDWQALPDFASLEPVKTGSVPAFDIDVAAKAEQFAIRFGGRISIPATGPYTFFLNCDDGGKLYIDGALVADDDGGHAAKEVTATVDLKAGMHTIVVAYFQGRGQQLLNVDWQGPAIARQKIPASVLFAPLVKK